MQFKPQIENNILTHIIREFFFFVYYLRYKLIERLKWV